MNTPAILLILAALFLILLVFLIRWYLKKNLQDLKKLESELKDSDKK
jgi:hypothetical protein